MRIKRVLKADGHPGIIDLHSANQYNPRDGFNNSANLYMEHFPYLDRLWFGESFDYENSAPDFFLTEVSGIPFGLMGEIVAGQSWGIGSISGTKFKGGWGPSTDGKYLVRQIGVLKTPSGYVGVAIKAEAPSGSFDDGRAALDKVAGWLQEHLGSLPAGQCSGSTETS